MQNAPKSAENRRTGMKILFVVKRIIINYAVHFFNSFWSQNNVFWWCTIDIQIGNQIFREHFFFRTYVQTVDSWLS